MNSLAIILGYNVTIGLPEMIIFLLAAILLGFSIHFYWAGKKSVPGLKTVMPDDDTTISEEDQSRLQLYEQIERHEKSEDRLKSELMRMAEAEKSLLKELEETRDEVSRLERAAEKKIVSEPVIPMPTATSNPARQFSELVIAQQHLNESLSKEMTERLERAYEEFNFLQERINKIHSQVIDPTKRNFEFDELEQSYFRLTKEYDELKIKHLTLMDETQRITRALADAEEKLRDANFQKQQLSKKVVFLEELANDLQQMSGHHKKLEGQLRRISEIESLLSRTAQDKRS
jgi:predicted RNase H-like nuclease (RuvC/YqgF family)